MKKRGIALFLAVFLILAVLPISALAYDRQESTTTTGGTDVTVYKGLKNSNSSGAYLEDDQYDYLASNRYETAGSITSWSNITSSSNFVKKSAGSAEGNEQIVNGGVSGVSWYNGTNTLTLDNATGTVITIQGPSLNPSELNTYNSNLQLLIGDNIQNLTYFKQYDLFGEDTSAAPHTKDNETEQDTVYINIVGENAFNNISLSGNVKVVFTGTGTLTLDASQTWNYNDETNTGNPDFDQMSNPSSYALASVPTTGFEGNLEGETVWDNGNTGQRKRTITEWYEYALPEIEISAGLEIAEGGQVFSSAALGTAEESAYTNWASYVGTESGTPAGKVVISANDSSDSTLLKAIVNSMGDDTTVSNEQYDEYFKESTAEEGVKAIIAAGNFYINGYAIPATEEAYTADSAEEGYLVNQVAWLYQDGDTWKGGLGGGKTCDSYDAAALATATGLPAGLEVRLHDNDGDGKADMIETQYLEGVIINKIIDNNEDGTYSIDRGALDTSITYSENDGRLFDGSHFATAEDVVKKENFDATLSEGDIALFWYGPDGWVVDRPIEIKGIFVEGVDHKYYNMDGVPYQDAMRFSRDNIIISNRNGEFANAHNYFGFTDNDEGLEVTLWLVPTTDYPQTTGAPIGMTSNENADTFLERAIASAKEKRASVVVSTDGTDVAVGTKWTTQAVYDELSSAITRAETVLASDAGSALLDYQVYLLYLTLNGSGQDIGAKFAGYAYTGFDKQIYDGTGTATEAVNPYIAGYLDGTFAPDAKITRAEAAQMLYNLIQGDLITSPLSSASLMTASSFTDVDADDWYYKAVTYLANTGVISGYPDGSFVPDQEITRAEFTAIIVKYMGVATDYSTSFPDVASDYWAAGFIATAKSVGLVSGYPDGNFGPEDSTTRAEVVTILNKMQNRSTDSALFDGLDMPFSDVPKTHWAYYQIMAAAVAH